jgi:hypothetical protein
MDTLLTSFPSRDSAEDLAFGEDTSKPTAFPPTAVDGLLPEAAPPARAEEAAEEARPPSRLWFNSAGIGTSATKDPPLTVIAIKQNVLLNTLCGGYK